METQPPAERGTAALLFSAHVYCGQTVAHLSYCWALATVYFSYSYAADDKTLTDSASRGPSATVEFLVENHLTDKKTIHLYIFKYEILWSPRGLRLSLFSLCINSALHTCCIYYSDSRQWLCYVRGSERRAVSKAELSSNKGNWSLVKIQVKFPIRLKKTL